MNIVHFLWIAVISFSITFTVCALINIIRLKLYANHRAKELNKITSVYK